MFCTQCGARCEAGDRFCIECGAPLFDAEQTLSKEYKKKGRLWVPLVLLVVMIVVGTCAFCVFRGYSDPEMPWFTLRRGVLYMDGTYEGGAEMTVPATIDGQAVKGISAYCFSYLETVQEVQLPEGVEYIEDFAFVGSLELRSVKLPESVTRIGHGLFYDCGKLEAVYIPGSVTEMGYETFFGCTELKHVFFGGTAEEWEALYYEELPENAKVYLVSENGYTEYVKP